MSETIRETKTIELPESRAEVTMFTYLRNGDFRAIQKMIAGSIKVDVNGEPKMQDVSGAIGLEQQDFVLKLIIKEIKDAQGNIITNVDEFLYDLSIADGTLLYDQADLVSQSSNLSKDAKKK